MLKIMRIKKYDNWDIVMRIAKLNNFYEQPTRLVLLYKGNVQTFVL